MARVSPLQMGAALQTSLVALQSELHAALRGQPEPGASLRGQAEFGASLRAQIDGSLRGAPQPERTADGARLQSERARLQSERTAGNAPAGGERRAELSVPRASEVLRALYSPYKPYKESTRE